MDFNFVSDWTQSQPAASQDSQNQLPPEGAQEFSGQINLAAWSAQSAQSAHASPTTQFHGNRPRGNSPSGGYSYRPQDQLAALGLMLHPISQQQDEEAAHQIQSAEAQDFPGDDLDRINSLKSEIETEAATIICNIQRPDAPVQFGADDTSFSLGPITIELDHSVTREDRLVYIRDRAQDIKTWSTTNVGASALHYGFSPVHNYPCTITPTYVSHPGNPEWDQSAENFNTFSRINFNGDPPPVRFRNQVWGTAETFPTTVRLFHEYLHFLRNAENTDGRDMVFANYIELPLSEAETVGLGQCAQDEWTENKLRSELGLPLRTFYGSARELDQDGSYPLLRYRNGTVVPENPADR